MPLVPTHLQGLKCAQPVLLALSVKQQLHLLLPALVQLTLWEVPHPAQLAQLDQLALQDLQPQPLALQVNTPCQVEEPA